MAATMNGALLARTMSTHTLRRLLQSFRTDLLKQMRHSSVYKTDRDPGELFIQSDVQTIVKKITGFNLDKIYRHRLTKIKPPSYKLLTEHELHELQEENIRKGQEKLQMPPVLKQRTEEENVLSNDPDIQGFESHRLVFTDITYGVHNKDRTIVVRETDGKLRHATKGERGRVLQIYYPRPGRANHFPKMFTEHFLQEMLHDKKYLYILDRACVQFEPDDPDYIRVTQSTYDYIAEQEDFEELRSTRHFGPMTFHLAYHNKVEGLMVDMIQQDLVGDAADVVRLHSIIHPTSVSAQLLRDTPSTADQEIIQIFSEKDTTHGGSVQLALQSYNDSQRQSSSVA